MDFIINFIIITLFICPIIALVHESGHAFFLKIFGAKVSEFSIGNGDVLWRKNNFFIKKAYFFGGRVFTEDYNMLSKNQRTFYFLGGVLLFLPKARITVYTFLSYLPMLAFASAGVVMPSSAQFMATVSI